MTELSDINRSILIMKPKHPFLDWTLSCREPMVDMILDRLCEDKHIFENELAGWTTDESEKPVRRGLSKFQKRL